MPISTRIIRKTAEMSQKPDNPDTRVRDRRTTNPSFFFFGERKIASRTPAYPVSPDFSVGAA